MLKLAQTCLNLSKLAQTCSNLSHLTFSDGKIGEERGPEVVAVQGESVVDDGGGEPQVVDDQGLLPQVGRLEQLQEAEVALALAVVVARVVVLVIGEVLGTKRWGG